VFVVLGDSIHSIQHGSSLVVTWLAFVLRHRVLAAGALREFAAWGARKRYWRGEDVDDLPAYERPKSLPRSYGASERDRIMAVPLTGQDAVLRGLLYYGGLRALEAPGLRLMDLVVPHTLPDGTQLDGAMRVWGKGSKERMVPIHPDLWAILAPHLAPLVKTRTPRDRTIIAHPNGKPWSYDTLRDRIVAWGKAAEVSDPKAHRLRHTHATDLLELGADIRQVQEVLGHTSLDTTAIYLRVVDRRKAEAIRRLPSFPVSVPGYVVSRIPTEADAPDPAKTKGDLA
jgi:integrase/recombinase XerD